MRVLSGVWVKERGGEGSGSLLMFMPMSVTPRRAGTVSVRTQRRLEEEIASDPITIGANDGRAAEAGGGAGAGAEAEAEAGETGADTLYSP